MNAPTQHGTLRDSPRPMLYTRRFAVFAHSFAFLWWLDMASRCSHATLRPTARPTHTAFRPRPRWSAQFAQFRRNLLSVAGEKKGSRTWCAKGGGKATEIAANFYHPLIDTRSGTANGGKWTVGESAATLVCMNIRSRNIWYTSKCD